MRRANLLGPLGVRLALTFVGVSLAAVAVLVSLSLASTQTDVASLGRHQETAETAAVVDAASTAYHRSGSWGGAALDPALAVAADAGASVTIFDAAHHVLATSNAERPSPQSQLGPPVSAPVMVGAQPVGEVVLRFADSGLRPADRTLQSSLVRRVAVGAGLAALLALVVAVIVARRITRPVTALTRTARAMEAGQRNVRVGPINAPGELGDLAVAFDSMADAVSRQDQLRRDSAAGVAHELRTPISILQASCEAMLDGVVEPSTEAVSSLHDEVLRLAKMVEDLQVLSSAEAAELRLDCRPVDVAGIAGEAAAGLASRFAMADVELTSTLEPTVISADPVRLHQVVTNLLSNAAKFTPPGGSAQLTVSTTHDGARLEVTDTGPGIAADELDHVFERFYRGRTVTAAGSGVGLAVVAELTRAHGGWTTVGNRPSGGSRFVVSLPKEPRTTRHLHTRSFDVPSAGVLLEPEPESPARHERGD